MTFFFHIIYNIFIQACNLNTISFKSYFAIKFTFNLISLFHKLFSYLETSNSNSCLEGVLWLCFVAIICVPTISAICITSILGILSSFLFNINIFGCTFYSINNLSKCINILGCACYNNFTMIWEINDD